jgi:DNA-binding NtrC family response regulator
MALRVLASEDESVILDEILEYFSDENIPVTAAPDGLAAAKCFRQAPAGTFSVILTDLRMPGQDGYALAREIAATTAAENAVEILIMTGHGSYGSAFGNPSMPVFEFIRKPLNLDHLAETVRRAHASAMARRRQQRAKQPAPREHQAALD